MEKRQTIIKHRLTILKYKINKKQMVKARKIIVKYYIILHNFLGDNNNNVINKS